MADADEVSENLQLLVQPPPELDLPEKISVTKKIHLKVCGVFTQTMTKMLCHPHHVAALLLHQYQRLILT